MFGFKRKKKEPEYLSLPSYQHFLQFKPGDNAVLLGRGVKIIRVDTDPYYWGDFSNLLPSIAVAFWNKEGNFVEEELSPIEALHTLTKEP